jgi:trimethylamine:corrinoid methyltransferase-like protein
MLEAYRPPDLDPAIDEALGDYLGRRSVELGAETQGS